MRFIRCDPCGAESGITEDNAEYMAREIFGFVKLQLGASSVRELCAVCADAVDRFVKEPVLKMPNGKVE